MSWTTLGRILEGGSHFSSTLQKTADLFSERMGLKITIADLQRRPRPNELQILHKERKRSDEEPDCIDINDLPKVLVNKDGKPLTQTQQDLLRQYIDTLLGK